LTEPIPSQYESLLGEIMERIRSAQLVALRQVNREMITLYSDIGRLIVARQEGYMNRLSPTLSCCRNVFSRQVLTITPPQQLLR